MIPIMGYPAGTEVDNAVVVGLGVEVGIGEGEGVTVGAAVVVTAVAEGVDAVTEGDGKPGVPVIVGCAIVVLGIVAEGGKDVAVLEQPASMTITATTTPAANNRLR